MTPHGRGRGLYRTKRITLLDEHIDHMRRSGRAEGTMKRRRMVLTFLAEFLGHDPADATLDELDRWQSSLPSLREMRWKTAMIGPYYKFLRSRGYRSDNPAELLPRPRANFKVRTPIPDEDLFAAVLAAPMPVLAMLLLGGWSGMRAVEIAGLHREHVYTQPSADGEVQWWATVTGKGGGQRAVPVPGWVWERIGPLLPPAGPLFVKTGRGGGRAGEQLSAQNVTARVGKFLAGLGIDDRLHSLRHRVATAAWRATGDVRVVQQLLGHADLAVLHVYTHVHDDAVAAAVARIPRPAWPSDDQGPTTDPEPPGGAGSGSIAPAPAAVKRWLTGFATPDDVRELLIMLAEAEALITERLNGPGVEDLLARMREALAGVDAGGDRPAVAGAGGGVG